MILAIRPRDRTGAAIRAFLAKTFMGSLVLSVLSGGALSWAEEPTSLSLAGHGDGSELRVSAGREAEVIAVRALGAEGGSGQSEAAPGVALRAQEGFPSGTWRLGLMGGYSISHKIFAPRAVDVEFAFLLGQIGYTITDVHGPFPVRGSLELIVEPVLLVTTTPSSAFGQGASLILRYNFVTGTRWVPFFDVGPGILHWNLRLPTILGTQFNFTVQVGPGLHYFVADRLAITVQARLHHISNAGIDSPNIGVNSSQHLLGISYFF